MASKIIPHSAMALYKQKNILVGECAIIELGTYASGGCLYQQLTVMTVMHS